MARRLGSTREVTRTSQGSFTESVVNKTKQKHFGRTGDMKGHGKV